MPSLHPPLLLLLCALLPVPSVSFCGHTDMEECYFRMYSPASGTVVGGAALLCAACFAHKRRATGTERGYIVESM